MPHRSDESTRNKEHMFEINECNSIESKLIAAFHKADPDGERLSRVFRESFDQIYDGVHTGRYHWNQLSKTEKTHFGTIIEINIRRAFDGLIQDGDVLDYKILDTEVDCKYSQKLGSWMIPNEAVGHVAMVCHADDERSVWSLGFITITNDILGQGSNRDQKRTISAKNRSLIHWAWYEAPLPANVLLQVPDSTRHQILDSKSGQQRINRLFELVQQTLIPRGTVATVAQQKDYMKRIRGNGGARSLLREHGIIILGEYQFHQQIASALGLPTPINGDSISVRVYPTERGHDSKGFEIFLDDSWWRTATQQDPEVLAPEFKNTPTPTEKLMLGELKARQTPSSE